MISVISISSIKQFSHKHKKKLYGLAVAILVFIIFFWFLKVSINPVIIDTIEIKSKAIATRAMNSAIADIVADTILYESLINVVTNDVGEITVIQANALEINNLSRDLAQTTENKLDEYGDRGVDIPIGSFTGIPILVGQGPSLNLKVTPIGAVFCVFSSKFENAGINQTNHKIYLTITANLGIVMPLLSVKYTQQQQVLISESIIVGKVPEVYLYSDNLDNLLNFVPM